MYNDSAEMEQVWDDGADDSEKFFKNYFIEFESLTLSALTNICESLNIIIFIISFFLLLLHLYDWIVEIWSC